MKPRTASPNPPDGLTATDEHLSASTIRLDDMCDLGSSRVMLVDNNPPYTRTTELILANAGIRQLIIATSRNEIHQHLEKARSDAGATIDLMIIDMLADGIDAIALCRDLHSDNIPILLISPNVEWHDDAVSAALNAGAQDIIFKPVYPHRLLPRALTLIRLKKERDALLLNQQQLQAELAERRIVEARLQYLLNHDELTGLCNRKHLQQSVEVALLRTDLNQRPSTLVYIDLNQFKVINDLEGHDAGDRLLMTIADILRRHSGVNATISRINSDEYAILFTACDEKTAYSHANTIRQDIDNLQFRVDNRKYTVSASFGIIAIKPGMELTSNEVLACAGKACYEAKNKGRNKIHVFNDQDNQFNNLREDVYWIPLIKDALKHSGFKLLFQPVMALENNRIACFEALIRMIDANNELIGPDNFIPVAERNGLIQKIDLWVVSRAIDTLAAISRVNENITFNINLSSKTFNESSFLPLVSHKISQTAITPNRITFEITETAAVVSYQKGRETLQRLRQLGFKIALDDFGSGFNSFFQLKQLPVDYIKIDGSFITNLMSDPMDQTLVRSISEISKSLGKKTVAEFVLNQETLELLREYGIDYAQGNFIGRPGELSSFSIANG